MPLVLEAVKAELGSTILVLGFLDWHKACHSAFRSPESGACCPEVVAELGST